MSLGSIVRCWGAVGYEPDLRFFDHLYAVAHEHRQKFEHWTTDRLSVTLYDPGRHERLVISNGSCGFEVANPDDLLARTRQLIDIVRRGAADVSHGTLNRMGLELVTYADLGLTFEELMSQLRPLCLPEHPVLEKAVSGDITDVALHFDHKYDDGTAKIRIGPMRRDQGLVMIKNVGTHARLFASPDKGNGLVEFYAQIPDTFLYFDIEVFTKEPHRNDEWPTFAEGALAYATKMVGDIRAIVMEH